MICHVLGYVEIKKRMDLIIMVPFAQAGFLRSTLSEMRKKFGILLADANPVKLKDGRFQLYDDVRAEIFSGHNETTKEEYRERVENACSFLEGKGKKLVGGTQGENAKTCRSNGIRAGGRI
jgi:excinuclease ABC subunit C